MSKEPQTIKIPFSNYISLISFVKFLDVLGILFISFLFYIFINTLFPILKYVYIEYVVVFTLLAILISWYSRDCRFTFVIPSFPYFILLIASYFYL